MTPPKRLAAMAAADDRARAVLASGPLSLAEVAAALHTSRTGALRVLRRIGAVSSERPRPGRMGPRVQTVWGLS